MKNFKNNLILKGKLIFNIGTKLKMKGLNMAKKKNIPDWIVAFCIGLTFLSIFCFFIAPWLLGWVRIFSFIF